MRCKGIVKQSARLGRKPDLRSVPTLSYSSTVSADSLDKWFARCYSCTMVQLNNRIPNPQLARRLEKLLSPRFFKALGDPTRIGLLVSLAASGEAQTVSDIASGTSIDMSVVSRHLAILREAGVIECEKRGKEVWYSIRAGAVVQMLRDLADCVDSCCVASSSPGVTPSQRSKEK